MPNIRHSNPCSHHWKDENPKFLVLKAIGDEDQKNHRTIENREFTLKGLVHRSCVWAHILGSSREKGAHSRLESCRERAEGTAAKVPVLSPSSTLPAKAIFPGWSTPFQMSFTWGNALVPPF